MKKIAISIFLCLALLIALLPVTAFAATEISTIRINGLNYPEPNQSFSQYSAFTTTDKGISFYSVDWYDRTSKRFMEGNDVFLPDHEYSVQIWVEAEDGYTFKCADDNTPSVAATIDGYPMYVTKAFEYKAFAMVVLTYEFSYLPQNGWVKSVDLRVPAPVAGENPSYTQLSSSQYLTNNVYFSGQTDRDMLNGIAWYQTDNNEKLSPNDAVFEVNTAYTFHCLVLPKEGYRIAPNASVKVNGSRARARLDYDSFLAVYYDFPKTASAPAHTHTLSQWRTTQVYHYLVCTTCGEMLDQEDHIGGTATCQEDGVCTVCGYAYLPASEDMHVPDTSKWIARGEMYHFHKCTLCGAHCDIEDHRWSPKYHAVDESGHAYQCADCKGYDKVHPHNPGPEATDTTPQTCNDCGFIIAPAKNHKHNLTRVEEVPATCTEEGTAQHYKCDGCPYLFADAEGKTKLTVSAGLILSPLGHMISDEFYYDDGFHWRCCTRCDIVLEETKLIHDLEQDTCATCGYVLGQEPSVQPSEPEKNETSNQHIFLIVGIILLIVIFTFAAAAVVVLVILIVKKKKR